MYLVAHLAELWAGNSLFLLLLLLAVCCIQLLNVGCDRHLCSCCQTCRVLLLLLLLLHGNLRRYLEEEGALPGRHGPSGTVDWLRSSEVDLPAELLADADSQFIEVDGLLVHYKEAWPGRSREGTLGSLRGGEGSAQLTPLLQQLPHQKQWPELEAQQETLRSLARGRAARPNGAAASCRLLQVQRCQPQLRLGCHQCIQQRRQAQQQLCREHQTSWNLRQWQGRLHQQQ